ncbi:MAG: uncharacterized protein HW416_1023 [Chloroflexi bacterium]|nr:uncharacterized protein [Chloroflexota bacterium]
MHTIRLKARVGGEGCRVPDRARCPEGGGRGIRWGKRRRPLKDYVIKVFWSDEDDCWIADVSDLKVGSAFGSPPDEAVREVIVAGDLWMESARELGKVQLAPALRQRP